MTNEKRLNIGSVHIDEHVIVDIIRVTIAGISGVSVKQDSMVKKIARLIHVPDNSGIMVKFGKGGEVSVAIDIYVRYGLNIPVLAREVQDKVKNAILKAIEIEIKDINVTIRALERG